MKQMWFLLSWTPQFSPVTTSDRSCPSASPKRAHLPSPTTPQLQCVPDTEFDKIKERPGIPKGGENALILEGRLFPF